MIKGVSKNKVRLFIIIAVPVILVITMVVMFFTYDRSAELTGDFHVNTVLLRSNDLPENVFNTSDEYPFKNIGIKIWYPSTDPISDLPADYLLKNISNASTLIANMTGSFWINFTSLFFSQHASAQTFINYKDYGFPVIILSEDLKSINTQKHHLSEKLASNGFVVVMISSEDSPEKNPDNYQLAKNRILYVVDRLSRIKFTGIDSDVQLDMENIGILESHDESISLVNKIEDARIKGIVYYNSENLDLFIPESSRKSHGNIQRSKHIGFTKSYILVSRKAFDAANKCAKQLGFAEGRFARFLKNGLNRIKSWRYDRNVRSCQQDIITYFKKALIDNRTIIWQQRNSEISDDSFDYGEPKSKSFTGIRMRIP